MKPGVIPDALWSEEPLSRTPPQPPPTIEELADKVEEQRLKRMGADLEMEDIFLDKLTTKFVRDWLIKTKVNGDGAKEKKWLRRSRLVAREFANDKRDDVYSPASGSYSLRPLPLIFLSTQAMDHLDAPMMCFGRRFYKASRMMSFAKNDAYDLRNCCVKLRNDAYCSSYSVVSTSDVVNQEMIPSVENGVQRCLSKSWTTAMENMREGATPPRGAEWNPEPIEISDSDFNFMNKNSIEPS